MSACGFCLATVTGLVLVRGARFPVARLAGASEPGYLVRAGRSGRRDRRGMVLIVVLLIISMLGLLAGSFAFRMNAELAGVKATADLQQARLAAESGIDRMIYLLRDQRTNVDFWYDNAEDFRRVLVWAPGFETGSTSLWDKDAVPGRPGWRFSIVSYKEQAQNAGKETKMRYGLTDEAGKLNIANTKNPALRAQLLALFNQIKRENVVPEILADSLIDWQDKDENPTSVNGAESSYYITRNPPYRSKNRPLQSVEELLMVRGFDGQILWGEDANRNGYLDDNENDGPEGVFPPDNADDVLDRGIYPYVTVYSWDWNASNDNKRRIPLSMIRTTDMLQDTQFQYLTQEIRPEVIQFIVDANQRGYKFRSVGELCGIEIYENKTSNYTQAWKDYDQLIQDLNAQQLDQAEEETPEEEQQESTQPASGSDMGGPGGENAVPGSSDNQNGADRGSGNNKSRQQRQQSIREPNQDTGNAGSSNQPGSGSNNPGSTGGRGQGRPRGNRDNRSGGTSGGGRSRAPGALPNQQELSQQRRDRGLGGRANQADQATQNLGTPLSNPITVQDMVAICDRFTVSTDPIIPGLINVNTAPAAVLRTIPGLTEENVAAILSQREQLSGEDKASIGWLVAYGALDAQTFALVSNLLTTRSIQFSADVIGFADHTGAYKRFQVVVEMRGQMSQILYFRDVTSLGAGYPVWDDKRSEGLAYSDQ
jgi:type II secretory pathway component PulK